jgi:hypothetical protein
MRASSTCWVEPRLVVGGSSPCEVERTGRLAAHRVVTARNPQRTANGRGSLAASVSPVASSTTSTW